jgi:hypothetical protein
MPAESVCSLSAVRRSTRTRPAPALIAIGAILVMVPLAGCGEKAEPATTGPVVAQSTSPIDGSTTTSTTTGRTDQALAADAARSFLSSPDAATVCDDVITPELLKGAYGDRSGCLAARKPQSLAQSVQLSEVQLTGTTATLSAKASGGVFGNGEQVKLTVTRDATGTWRVSKVESNAPVGP